MTSEQQKRPRVAVIGAGLIGVSTCYWLGLSNQYDIVCFEKGSAPAPATSHANAGRFCPSVLGDYAPKLSALKQVFFPTASVAGVGSVSWNWNVVRFGAHFVSASTFRQDEIRSTLNELAQLSSRLMSHLLSNVISLNVISPNVWLYTSKNNSAGLKTLTKSCPGTLFSSVPDCSTLLGLQQEASCLKIDSDYTADAREFTQKLSEHCNHTSFHFQTVVRNCRRLEKGTFALDVEKSNNTSDLDTTTTTMEFDYIVLCAGPWSNQLTKKFWNFSLPILPLRGASLTLQQVENSPSVGFVDQNSGSIHFQVTPFPHHHSLRVVGFADVVEEPHLQETEQVCPPHYKEELLEKVKQVLPQVTWKTDSLWCGIRPVSPDRLPILGKVDNAEGVFLNVGHGAVGWTLAAASGYLLTASMLKEHGLPPLRVDSQGDGFDANTRLNVRRFKII